MPVTLAPNVTEVKLSPTWDWRSLNMPRETLEQQLQQSPWYRRVSSNALTMNGVAQPIANARSIKNAVVIVPPVSSPGSR